MAYAAVVVDTPIDKVFHYAVPGRLAATAPGDRVLVPFGRQKLRGVVVAVNRDCPIDTARVKEIVDASDPDERLPADLLEITRWVADYYHTSWGVVLAAALPAAIRAERRAATRRYVALRVPPNEADAQADALPRAPRQAAFLRKLAEQARAGGGAPGQGPAWRPFAPLAEATGADGAVLKSLAARGLVEYADRVVGRDEPEIAGGDATVAPAPTASQAAALREIVAALDGGRHQTFLLHGVTGSGKTEVYLRALAHTLARGRSVLTLVPEISLTPQTVARFRSRAAAPVAVLHSHMSDGERATEWRRIARGEARVVVGARSAVFAPLTNLGLVVVDEEHERSYKQDSDPRYHGRDVAVLRAAKSGAVALLGSATPALESWTNAARGKYRLLSLPERPGKARPVRVEVVDLKREWAELKKPAVISRALERALNTALERGEQSILFLNRRGFHTTARCEACGEVLQCGSCDIPLTYHRARHLLRCHYCGADVAPPERCPACSHAAIRYVGTGVERVEDVLAKILPAARILRMDADTMSAVGAHAAALSRFGRGEADILLGTQMVTKGLDFPNVTVVGVLQADGALTLPEFRAAERTFQLVTQVVGRAGRADKPGLAVVQAFQPDHHAIRAALAQDYAGFVADEAPDREELSYPPYGKLARILVRGADGAKTGEVADAAGIALRSAVAAAGRGGEVLGPAACFLARVQGEFRFHLLLKAADHGVLSGCLRRAGIHNGERGGVRTTVDIDPQSLL